MNDMSNTTSASGFGQLYLQALQDAVRAINGINASFASVIKGVPLSVRGNATNATASLADIAGAAAQVLRVNDAGTALAFGAIDLAQAAAVTGTLGVGHGGTGTATAFTQGSVIFAGASGIYSQDNASLFWNDGTLQLGVGTATPDINARLDVHGSQLVVSNSSGDPGISIFKGDASAGSQYFNMIHTSTDLIFGPATSAVLGGTTERMRLTTAGTLNLGVTNPLTLTWSGSTVTAPEVALYVNANATGSSSASAVPFNYLLINSDNVTAGAGINVSDLYLQHQFGGAACVGNRAALSANAFLIATSGNTGGQSYSGASIAVSLRVNDGGTGLAAGTAKGQGQGANILGITQSGATNLYQISACEFDTALVTGASAYQKIGVAIVDLASSTVAGSVVDCALSFANASGAVGWTNAILFGRPDGVWPLKSTGTLIAAWSTGGTVGSFIDMTNVTVTNNIFTFTNFSLSGAGGMVLAAATGGNKGAGTINVSSGVFLNNTSYTNPDYALEHYFTGKITKFADKPGASRYHGLIPLNELEEYLCSTLRMRGIGDDPVDIFERADIALEKIEEATIYICQLHRRVEELEKRLLS